MDRRAFIQRGVFGAAALGWGLGSGEARAIPGAAARPPNIVFIFVDDLGYGDPSCFGNAKAGTPNIDALAEGGTRFTNFYTSSPICSPSRVAVMTGQYPARWGIHSYLNSRVKNRARGMRDFLDPAAPTTARVLKRAGYATAHFGKWHVGGGRDVDDAPLPSAYGFDESLVSFEGLGDRVLFEGDGLSKQSAELGQGTLTWLPKHRSTETYVDRAIDFVRRNRERPFYLELFPNDVHDGHLPAEGAAKAFEDATENPFERRFFAVLRELDRQIGRLLGALEALGLDEETLVVFTSDNGPTDWPHYYKKGHVPPGSTGPFRGRKWCLYEGGIRMPFIARWKGRVPAGETNEEAVFCGVDLAPTFCALAGVAVPAEVRHDGVDVSEALLGKGDVGSRPIFWQYGAPFAELRPGNPDFASPSFAVREGDWKLLINPDGSGGELYDVRVDPGETKNLGSEHPERVEKLWGQIRGWAAEMKMPLGL